MHDDETEPAADSPDETPDPPEDPHAGTRFVCVCECGGNVRGSESFNRLWTYCDKCTPVVKVKFTRGGVLAPAEERNTK